MGPHTYYGARVCVSCRGFFRRSVQSGQYQFFTCQGKPNNDCPVDGSSRRSCKSCRFRRCSTAGMRPSYVLSNEQRQDRIVRRNHRETETR